MTRRMWQWVAVLSVLAAVDLSATIRAAVHWQPPAGSQASLTLPQALGFATSGAFVIVIALIVITGWRSWRERRRVEAWRRLDLEAARAQSHLRYIKLHDPE